MAGWVVGAGCKQPKIDRQIDDVQLVRPMYSNGRIWVEDDDDENGLCLITLIDIIIDFIHFIDLDIALKINHIFW